MAGPSAPPITDRAPARRDIAELAFLVVYGQPPPLQDPDMECPPGRREPAGVVELGGGLIALLVIAEVGDSHACAAPTSIHYLRRAGGRLTLVRSWPDLIAGASHGQAAKLAIRRDLFTYPAVESSSGGTWQGYTCGRRRLTELTPRGPVERLSISSHFSDAGVRAGPGRPDYEASIEPGKRDLTLVVSYRWDGKPAERVQLQRMGDRFHPIGARRLPEGC